MNDKSTSNTRIEEISDVIGEDLLSRLLGVIQLEGLLDWFYQPNNKFDNQTPYNYSRKYGIEALESMIYNLESGNPK